MMLPSLSQTIIEQTFFCPLLRQVPKRLPRLSADPSPFSRQSQISSQSAVSRWVSRWLVSLRFLPNRSALGLFFSPRKPEDLPFLTRLKGVFDPAPVCVWRLPFSPRSHHFGRGCPLLNNFFPAVFMDQDLEPVPACSLTPPL